MRGGGDQEALVDTPCSACQFCSAKSEALQCEAIELFTSL